MFRSICISGFEKGFEIIQNVKIFGFGWNWDML